mmetsp:Transcript_5398/g.13515  ORF Transcript_5398/g.13515 Transcript_5398/m.13515 type:complete len:112 (-) Transcript_5398:1090-1425(-)
MALSQVINMGMYVCFAMLLFGERVFQYLNLPVPQVYEEVQDKKMLVALGIWFFAGFVLQNLQQTGAFEIYYNTLPVFSKLEFHRMPMREELIQNLNLAIEESKARFAGGAS